jgi:hypothetical protein
VVIQGVPDDFARILEVQMPVFPFGRALQLFTLIHWKLKMIGIGYYIFNNLSSFILYIGMYTTVSFLLKSKFVSGTFNMPGCLEMTPNLLQIQMWRSLSDQAHLSTDFIWKNLTKSKRYTQVCM